MKPNIARMQKKGAILSVYHVRKLRSKFDGKTQAVRGALIADLEGLHRWALEKLEEMKRSGVKEKTLSKWLNTIRKIPKDPVKFFRQILRLKPYPYQARFLRDNSALKVLRWCRRAGKTTVMSGDDICFAANNPNSTILVIMPNFQQIKEIIGF